MVIGLLFVSVFCAVLFAYACTEYLLTAFDIRRRVLLGDSGLAGDSGVSLIVGVHLVSFALLLISSLALVIASGLNLYLQALVIAAGAQMIWVTEHLWFYYQDRLRLTSENGIDRN